MQEVVRLAVVEYIDRHSRQDAARSGPRRRTAAIRRCPAAAGRVIYLDLEDLLHIADRVLDGEVAGSRRRAA